MTKMLCLQDFEEYAKNTLDRKTYAFYSQGAEREVTLRENIRAFTRCTFVPRWLSSKEERDLSTTVLGEKLSMPIGIAPMSYQRLAHPDGELAAARAATDAGAIYTLSTSASSSIQEVAASRPNTSPLWMQLYVFKDRKGTMKIIRWAEENGFKAIVLTVDRPVNGLQLKLWRNGLDLPPHIRARNIENALGENQTTMKVTRNHISHSDILNSTLSWEDVAWVKSVSKLPVILKGILSVEDALEAVKYGASAVWISNHGGRQLDCVPTSLNVLPDISNALAGTGCEIYVDGGVRWGSDVLKALALGARCVFVGRPILYGLNHSGQDGVRSVQEILRSELDRAMHLAGCNSIREIGPHLIQKRQQAKI
ncbi:Hydroxyacid oxidase 1 [Araneus ventricosus]|uniref:(S)-2-hydroxy-acid oxidase n=1 Tax=Araneus ventricosus TaxID=182803 RepID=A0A4Y2C1W9_ARAVE|nr:Hydroxyacid oxidase 1 [Araneus ventricosus]